MDRRDRDRDRDRRYPDGETTRMGGGESYRPIARPRSRSPAQYDGARSRSPIRRDRPRTPPRERARSPLRTETYRPSERNRSPMRRRSRSPPYRPRERTPPRDIPDWRARERPRSPMRARSPPRARSPIRARSPPRRSPRRSPRRFSPRRDDDRRDRRSPPRREAFNRDRRRSRSPFDSRPPSRARSPFQGRRSPPQGPRGQRSPPRGPRSDEWRRRSPSPRPARVETQPTSLVWRKPRSPSPAPPTANQSSHSTSRVSSRLSSPQPHSGRVAEIELASRPSNAGSPMKLERSPPRASSVSIKGSAKGTPRERSPVSARERPASPRPKSPPRGPAGFKAPTGPSGARNFLPPIRSPVIPDVSQLNAPPSGPRGFAGRGGSIRGGRGGFPGSRIESIPSRSTIPPSKPAASPSPISPVIPSSAIPTGPRAGSISGPRPSAPTRPAIVNTSSYSSRGGRFDTSPHGPRIHPAMSQLPPIIPGGKVDPAYLGIPPELSTRIKKNEEEAERVREELYAKETELRRGTMLWNRLERESNAAHLRTELSERHLRSLAGEGVGGAAF